MKTREEFFRWLANRPGDRAAYYEALLWPPVVNDVQDPKLKAAILDFQKAWNALQALAPPVEPIPF